MTENCSGDQNCPFYVVGYMDLNIKCGDANNSVVESEKNVECFSHVDVSKSIRGELIVNRDKSRQLEDVLPGFVGTFKNEPGHARLLTTLFAENKTIIICTCGIIVKPNSYDVTNVKVVAIKIFGNNSQTKGCSFQTNTDDPIFKRFSRRKSHLSNLYILNDNNKEQECTIDINSPKVVGLQCGPPVNYKEKYKRTTGQEIAYDFVTEPKHCFENVNSFQSLDSVLPGAAAHPKSKDMTDFGMDRHSRYIVLPTVNKPTKIICKCHYGRNKTTVYTCTMIINVTPPPQPLSPSS